MFFTVSELIGPLALSFAVDKVASISITAGVGIGALALYFVVDKVAGISTTVGELRRCK